MDLTKLTLEQLALQKSTNEQMIGDIKDGLDKALMSVKINDDELSAKQTEIETLQNQNVEIDLLIKDRKGLDTKNKQEKESVKGMDKIELFSQFIENIGNTSEKQTPQLPEGFKQELIKAGDHKVVIPTDTTYATETEAVPDFKKHITVAPVKTSFGKLAVSSIEDVELLDIEEGEDFPLLKGLLDKVVNYETTAKGGKFALTYKYIRDYALPVATFILENLVKANKKRNNKDIKAEWDKLTSVDVTTLDELKRAFLEGVSSNFVAEVVMSRTAFVEISMLKGLDAKYIFSPDPTKADEYNIFGKKVYVYDDVNFGEDGTAVAYLVSKKAVTQFDLETFTLKYETHDNLTTNFSIYSEYDVKLTESKAGIKLNIDFTDEATDLGA